MTSLRDRRVAYARQLVGAGQYDKAISLYGVIVAEDPSDVETLIELGALHVRAARHDKAASAYERAGEQLHRAGRHEQALAVLREVQRLLAERPQLAGRFPHVTTRIAEIERVVAAQRRLARYRNASSEVLLEAIGKAWQAGDTKAANELAGLLHGRPVPEAPADDELSGEELEIVEDLPPLGSPHTSWIRELQPSAARTKRA